MKILVDALYIKKGGGLTVLIEVLNSLPEGGDIDIIIDNSLRQNLSVKCYAEYNFMWKESSIFNKCLYYNIKRYDSILALGNFPGIPLYRSNLYVYNMQYFLFDRSAINGKLKMFWVLKFLVINTLFILTKPILIVQSNWMRFIAMKSGIRVRGIEVVPIYKDEIEFKHTDSHNTRKFLYITSEYPYKNNDKVLEIFKGIKHLELYITIVGHSAENIHFLGSLGHDELIRQIDKLRPTIIQASDVESFGITLIEAALSNSQLLVLDRPYVDSVVSECTKFSDWNHLEEIILSEVPIKIPKSIITNSVQELWQLLGKM